MMNKYKKEQYWYIIFIMLWLAFTSINVYAQDNFKYEPKVYCELNENDNYFIDSVLVLIDKNISEVNKVLKKLFPSEFYKDIITREIPNSY